MHTSKSCRFISIWLQIVIRLHLTLCRIFAKREVYRNSHADRLQKIKCSFCYCLGIKKIPSYDSWSSGKQKLFYIKCTNLMSLYVQLSQDAVQSPDVKSGHRQFVQHSMQDLLNLPSFAYMHAFLNKGCKISDFKQVITPLINLGPHLLGTP